MFVSPGESDVVYKTLMHVLHPVPPRHHRRLLGWGGSVNNGMSVVEGVGGG